MNHQNLGLGFIVASLVMASGFGSYYYANKRYTNQLSALDAKYKTEMAELTKTIPSEPLSERHLAIISHASDMLMSERDVLGIMYYVHGEVFDRWAKEAQKINSWEIAEKDKCTFVYRQSNGRAIAFMSLDKQCFKE